jgi:aminoglycoside 6'-N-acetyltransferase
MLPDPARRYNFRPVTEADMSMLAAWLGTPHVAAWWGEPDIALANIRQHMDSASVRPYIIELNDTPIGYIQSYAPHLEEDHPYRDQPEGTLGIDQFIGKSELVGMGHGPCLIGAFVDQLFRQGAPRVVTDPDPTNMRAIRAYEKATFRPLGERNTIYGHVLLMARDAEEGEK